jgi:NAD(P) transhydrogenase
MERYDLVVIGAGPAGEKGAAQAAYFGRRVALVEMATHPGGAGINTGTVPSKTLRETALFFSGLGARSLYGVDYQIKANLTVQDFMYREQEVVRALREVVHQNIERHRIDFIYGRASFDDPHTIRVTHEGMLDRVLHGDVILIGAGSVPTRPKDVPFSDTRIRDSDDILKLERLPNSMAVIGAGVIGCEYSTIFAALGIKVTLLDGRDRLLNFLDAEIADRLRLQMQFLGVDVRLKENVTS